MVCEYPDKPNKVVADSSPGTISFCAGMVFGYDTVANGASVSMPAFFLYFGAIGPTGPYLPSNVSRIQQQSPPSINIDVPSVGCALGRHFCTHASDWAFGTGFLLDRVGRRWPASAAGIVTIIGTAVQFTCHTRVILLAGKMVTGLGVGVAMASATSYASEVSSLYLLHFNELELTSCRSPL